MLTESLDLRVAERWHILRDTMTSLARLFGKALEAATPTVEALAARLGLSSSALRRYRLGSRTPSPRLVRAFAAELRREARVLEGVADQLDELTTQEADDA